MSTLGRIAWGWLVLWAAFVGYAAVLAPPDDPALTRALLRGMVSGHFDGVDPAIAAVFSMLGVVPVVASTFVLRDGNDRRLPAWPFAIGMFVVGAFALLPWLAFRAALGPRVAPVRGFARRVLASRTFHAGCVVALASLSAWALVKGHRAAYLEAFRTTSMVNVMTIDLAVCTALLYVLVEEARARLTKPEPTIARAVRFIPLFGPALWSAIVVP